MRFYSNAIEQILREYFKYYDNVCDKIFFEFNGENMKNVSH